MTSEEKCELAGQITENPIFQNAVDEMREDLISEWANSGESDSGARDLCWRHVRFMDVFLGKLKGYINRAVESRIDLP